MAFKAAILSVCLLIKDNIKLGSESILHHIATWTIYGHIYDRLILYSWNIIALCFLQVSYMYAVYKIFVHFLILKILNSDTSYGHLILMY